MAKITIVSVGKMKDSSCNELAQEYLGRLSRYTPSKIIEVADSKSTLPNIKNEEEGKKILEKITDRDWVVVLDEKGNHFSSQALAKQIQTIWNRGNSHLVFVLGGPFGHSSQIKARANLLLSLSTLTLPHELARVFLLEQLYRAHTILKGEKYHH